MDESTLLRVQILATLQSAAFVEGDRERLLDLAAAAIPDESRVARAIADTRRWVKLCFPFSGGSPAFAY